MFILIALGWSDNILVDAVVEMDTDGDPMQFKTEQDARQYAFDFCIDKYAIAEVK